MTIGIERDIRALLPDLGRRTLIMGILNVTPDSFSDGGCFVARDAALAHASLFVDEGADIIDVGGESTRPGHTPVPEADEIARITPIVEGLREHVALPISIDTYKAATARAALTLGAHIVNDIWGLQREPEIARVAADFGAPVIVMHNRAQIDATLDIIEDMRAFFDRSLAIAHAAGIPDHHIILDPGIGFGKTLAQELDALGRISELKAFGHKVLVGASRKSFIGKLSQPHQTSPTRQNAASLATPGEPKTRLFGSVAAHMLAITGGADIIRVHDVAQHWQAAHVVDAVVRRSAGAGSASRPTRERNA
jgi:dihydropteroate synthase